MSVRVRKRTLVKRTEAMKMVQTYDGKWQTERVWNPVVELKTQETTDEPTSWPMVQRQIRDYPNSATTQDLKKLDWGGDFISELSTLYSSAGKHYTDQYVSGYSVGSGYKFTGYELPRLDTLAASEGRDGAKVSSFDRSSLIGVGSTAISRTIPTSPIAESASFVGELLRDGIPSIVGKSLLMDRIHYFRSLGSEYLNVEFGWKPFINDLRKFAYVVENSHRELRRYRLNSGKVIRRRYRFPQIVTSRVLYGPKAVQAEPLGFSYAYADPYTGVAQQSGFEYKTTDYWFSGAYTYYLDEGVSQRDKMERHAQEAAKLLGTRITPEVLWNLAPWSWAVDWIANFGDVLRNLSALSNDGTVMRRGYVMGKFDITHTHESSGVRWYNGTSSGPARTISRNTVKMRQHATPYGFGLDPAVDFTARQYAIIAALGISRGNRVGW